MENANGFRGIYVLNSLAEPEAATIKKIEKLVDRDGTVLSAATM